MLLPGLFFFWFLCPRTCSPVITTTSNRRLSPNSLFVVEEFDPIHTFCNLDSLSHLSTKGSKKGGGHFVCSFLLLHECPWSAATAQRRLFVGKELSVGPYLLKDYRAVFYKIDLPLRFFSRPLLFSAFFLKYRTVYLKLTMKHVYHFSSSVYGHGEKRDTALIVLIGEYFAPTSRLTLCEHLY